MRWIVIAVIVAMVAVAACKGGDQAGGAPAGGVVSADKPGTGGGGPSTGGDGACPPMPGLCKRFPAADLATLFETPALSGTEDDHDGGPMGSLDDCAYKEHDDKASFDLLLRYECFNGGARQAIASYKGIHDTMVNMGYPVEQLPGLGDEAFWRYSGSAAAIIQGGVKARKGGVIITVDYGGYGLGGKQVSAAVAKQRAVDLAKRVVAALP